MINNLHSLLNSKWFINEQYGHALLPSLYAVLNGSTPSKPLTENPSAFIATASNLENAKNFNASSNQENFVLVMPLKDPIYKYNQECGPTGTKTKMAIMGSYEKEPHCLGVVLDIDSGGGQVSGTPEFHDFIKNFSKPVVAYTDGMMCSAAYYIGSAASHIVANNRVDAIGSIGTMVHFIDTTGIFEKNGAKVITAYATKSTDKNKDFESLIKGDAKGYIKNVLDPITETFHQDVKAARPNVSDAVLTGGTYNAEDSLNLNLIDEIGTLQTAISKVMELSKPNTETNSNKNNSKHTNMSKLNVPLIEAAIGAAFTEGETENGIILTDEQATAIETALANANQIVADAQTVATTNQETVTALESKTTAFTTAVQNALIAAEVEHPETLNNEAGIAALSQLIAKYGSKDGATPTTVFNDADNDTGENPNHILGNDVSGALNC